MLFLSFKNGKDYPRRNSFDKYHMPLAEIKYLIALTDNKPFFDQSVRNKQKEYEKLVEMSKNNDYKTGNYMIICIIKIIINFLAKTYQNKKLRISLENLIL